jgi:hypothetical protein
VWQMGPAADRCQSSSRAGLRCAERAMALHEFLLGSLPAICHPHIRSFTQPRSDDLEDASMSKHFSTAARNVLSAITKIDQVPAPAPPRLLVLTGRYATTCVPFMM